MSSRFRITAWITTGFLIASVLGLGYLYLFEKREAQRRLAELRRLADEQRMDVPVVTELAEVVKTAVPMEKGITVADEIPHGSLPIVPESELARNNATRQVIIRLPEGTDGDDIAKTIRELYGSSVKVSWNKSSNSLLIIGTEINLKKAMMLTAELLANAQMVRIPKQIRVLELSIDTNRKRYTQKDATSLNRELEEQLATLREKLSKQTELFEQIQAGKRELDLNPGNAGKEISSSDQSDSFEERVLKSLGASVLAKNSSGATRQRSDSFTLDDFDHELELQSRQLAARIRTANPDDMATLKNELHTVTVKQFEYRQKLREQELESLTQRIQSLKTKNLQRQNHRAEIIARRMNDLLKTEQEMGWDDPDVSSESTTNDAAAGGNSIVTAKSGLRMADKTSVDSKPESMFNGVTLSEWMRALKNERNPQKLSEAILAMNRLADEADPRELARAVLKTIRSYGSRLEAQPFVQGDLVIESINRGAIRLLTNLPSEIVVQEIIAELKTSRERSGVPNPTQEFLWNYFRLLRLQFITHTLVHSAGMDFQAESSRLKTSMENLRAEIRRKSRRIIGELITVGYSDEESLEWVTSCAGQIVRISGQTIRTYPELIPFVEREFERLVAKPPTTAQLSRSIESSPAILLGEAGLRIPEILDYASKQLGKEIPAISSGMIWWNGENNPNFLIFNDALNCLKSIASESPDAVNLLVEKLNQSWEGLEALHNITKNDGFKIEDVDTTATSGKLNYNFNLGIESCYRIISTLESIGTPAATSIPLLQRIAEFTLSTHCIPKNSGLVNFVGPDGRPASRNRNLQDISESAIKAIQEAKPKAAPEPLPADTSETSPGNPDQGGNASDNQ